MGFFDDPANQPSSGMRPGGFGSNGPVNQPGPVATAPGPGGRAPGTTTSGTIDPATGTVTPTPPTGGGQDVAANQALWKQANQNPQEFIKLWAQAHGVQPAQTPQVVNQIVNAMKSIGLPAEYATPDEYGRSAGITYGGQNYKIVNGSGQWMFDTYLNAEGADIGTRPAGWNGGSGGMGGFGSLYATVPTEEEARNMPGIQFALDENNRRMMAGAAANGTLLNLRTQQAIGQSNIQAALGLGYLPLAQLQNQVKGQNTGSLLDLSKLGLSATSTGNQ